MTCSVRPYEPSDADDVVALSIRAWTPVFASMRAVLGSQLDTLLHGADWQVHQETAVREMLGDAGATAWVAETAGTVVGFVTVRIADIDRSIGEIAMLAVDPGAQRGAWAPS